MTSTRLPTPATANPSRRHAVLRWAGMLAMVPLAFVATLAARPYVMQALDATAPASAGATWQTPQLPPTWAPAQVLQPTRLPVASAAVTPSVQASLWSHGVKRAQAGERLALASGERFQLRMQAQRSGWVRVVGINAEGSATELWRTELSAGEDAWSPALRLQGLRGVETLRVIGADGRMQSFQILHV